MAKKLGKLALFGALAGAAAAGTYYYFQKRSTAPNDAFDDLDDFDEDLDDDLDDDFFEDSVNSTSGANGKGRSYMPLDLDNAKEIIGEKVIETIDKTKEKLEQLNVPEKLDKAKELISDKIAPTAPAEPVYTEMDMSTSSSAAYSGTDNGDTAASTEEFFNDSDAETEKE